MASDLVPLPIEKNSTCELCLRENIPVTKHHLIPQSEHPRILKKLLKNQQFSKKEMLTRIAWMCRPCHSQIHAILSNRELANEFNTLEKLKTVPDIAKFAHWISNKPVGLNVTIRRKK